MAYLECLNCAWSGDDTELVSLTDDLDDVDFSHCPDCNGQSFEHEDDE